MFELSRKIKLNEENLPFCESLYDYIKKKIYINLKSSQKEEDIKFSEKIKTLLGYLKVSL